MIDIHYTQGERKIWRATPRTRTGEMPDLDGATAELRITTSDGCLPLVADPDDRGFPFTLSPDALDLAPGRYAALFWIRWPDGQLRNYGRLVLHIHKGC
ncbi:hypothetical protein SAMN05444389_102425 [Paracoccus solventivorans]|uniref:Uncharacterized protein n=1 Tax=Paracoccus solventivorans TaxID=53463 RepID=A0A1M7EYZ0_9RHOB|nr:hypothetical protein [Paracoccus solventivorans]SHL97035.1 hypothetical protein SAMN05444389_102425 [Paracoccus solventivorans]